VTDSRIYVDPVEDAFGSPSRLRDAREALCITVPSFDEFMKRITQANDWDA
jgi:hypothetical protein